MIEWGDRARYTTDDVDIDRLVMELEIYPGGNGDWYVAVAPQGEGSIGRGVRIVTSGVRVHGLANAMADAYRAIRAAGARAHLEPHRREGEAVLRPCQSCGGKGYIRREER